MARIEKTVFLSYRHSDVPWALLIYKSLSARGYDVFVDLEGMGGGEFERIILTNLRARAHFLVLLTTHALDKCDLAEDWFRREIEEALTSGRHIVPIVLPGFDIQSYRTTQRLTGRLASLQTLNHVEITASLYDASIHRLANSFLGKPIEIEPYQVSQHGSVSLAKIGEHSAEYWLAEARRSTDQLEALQLVHMAILKLPTFVEAVIFRAELNMSLGYLEAAENDFRSVLKSDPDNLTVLQKLLALLELAGKDAEAQLTTSRITEVPRQAAMRVINHGLHLLLDGKFVAAADEFDYARQIDNGVPFGGECAIAYLKRGRQSMAEKRDGEAVRDFRMYRDLGGAINVDYEIESYERFLYESGGFSA